MAVSVKQQSGVCPSVCLSVSSFSNVGALDAISVHCGPSVRGPICLFVHLRSQNFPTTCGFYCSYRQKHCCASLLKVLLENKSEAV